MSLFHDRWPWRKNAEGRTVLDLVPGWLRFALGAGLVLLALGGIMIRTAAHDPAVWHVDPFTAERTGKPNDAVAGPPPLLAAPADIVLDPVSGEAAALIARLHAVALGEPRVEVVAGGPEALHVTYVQRSALFGFPDYVSVRVEATDDGAALALWSRSRYGYSDMGVNRARLERWLAAIDLP